MTLIARLLPDSTIRGQAALKIPLLQFGAFLREYVRGQSVRADIVSGLDLETAEVTQLDILLMRIDAAADPLDTVQDIVDGIMLAERGLRYGVQAGLKTRLGV